jgi:F0F1-type ATP synthase assembly protein I
VPANPYLQAGVVALAGLVAVRVVGALAGWLLRTAVLAATVLVVLRLLGVQA